MLLTAFIVSQLILDITLILLFVAAVTRRRSEPRIPENAPPAWYKEFLRLAQELLTVTEPVLDILEGLRQEPGAQAVAPESPGEAGERSAPRDRRREAFALLRAGVEPEEVARRSQLQPGELRLIKNLVAAHAEAAEARRG